MRSVLSVDVAKCKSMVMLSTEYGEVLIGNKSWTVNFVDSKTSVICCSHLNSW